SSADGTSSSADGTSSSTDGGDAATVSGTSSTDSAEARSNDLLSSLDLTTLDTHYDDDDLDWDESEIQEISLSDDGSTSDSAGVDIDGSTVTITAGGVYRISGTLSDGQLAIAAPDDETVTVILAGAEITNSAGTAV